MSERAWPLGGEVGVSATVWLECGITTGGGGERFMRVLDEDIDEDIGDQAVGLGLYLLGMAKMV